MTAYINFADPPSKQSSDINNNFEELSGAVGLETSYIPEDGTVPIRSEANENFTGGRLKASPGTDPDDCVTMIQLDQLTARIAGIGQLWKDVEAQRTANSVYRNTTTRPIQVIIGHTNDSTGNVEVSPNNLLWTIIAVARINGGPQTVSFIVPPNHYYRTSGTVDTWTELS